MYIKEKKRGRGEGIKRMNDEDLEILAEEANMKGDNNLAIVLYAFLGARKAHMDGALAQTCQDWCTKRLEELDQFRNRKNN